MALTKIDDRGLKTPIDLLDNEKIRLGTGNDLQIYHSGTLGVIYNPNDNLKLISDIVHLQSNGGEPMLKAIENGAVELYHDNSKKFETTSVGIRVSGNYQANDGYHLYLGTGNDLDIYHDGSHSRIVNSTGNLLLDNSTGVDMYLNSGNDIYIRPQGSDNGIKLIGDGAVELYHNSSKKFETISSGAAITGSLGIGTTSPDQALHIKGNTPYIKFEDENDNQDWQIEARAFFGIYDVNDSAFRLTIDGSGKVLVGTTTSAPYSTRLLTVGDTSFDDTSLEIRSSSSTGRLYFTDSSSAGVGAYQGELTFEHLNGANRMHTKIGGTTKISVTTDGLTFNGDTAAVNALDDYEEGTFTPSFQNGLVASSYESNGQKGVYTKIGRYVFGTILLHLAGASAQNSNVIDIHGLPFTAGVSSTIGGQAGGCQYFYQDGFYNSRQFAGIVVNNTTRIRLYKKDDGSYLTGSDVNGGREIRLDFSYHAA